MHGSRVPVPYTRVVRSNRVRSNQVIYMGTEACRSKSVHQSLLVVADRSL